MPKLMVHLLLLAAPEVPFFRALLERPVFPAVLFFQILREYPVFLEDLFDLYVPIILEFPVLQSVPVFPGDLVFQEYLVDQEYLEFLVLQSVPVFPAVLFFQVLLDVPIIPELLAAPKDQELLVVLSVQLLP
jgi:hypothetical protein